MYSTQTESSAIKVSSDHHLSAAAYHEDAAASHRNAAAYYDYGNYHEAIRQAKLAKECGELALQNCDIAMK